MPAISVYNGSRNNVFANNTIKSRRVSYFGYLSNYFFRSINNTFLCMVKGIIEASHNTYFVSAMKFRLVKYEIRSSNILRILVIQIRLLLHRLRWPTCGNTNTLPSRPYLRWCPRSSATYYTAFGLIIIAFLQILLKSSWPTSDFRAERCSTFLQRR